MRFLLDTHVFLWYLTGAKALKPRTRELLRDPRHQVFVSPVSLWEALVKHHLSKLDLPENPGAYLSRQRARHGLASLALDEGSVLHLLNLPDLNRDPFDRLLICQALHHGLVLVTVDAQIRDYPVETLAG
ncbi:MAG: type II toxin-antitoxin system VapC family toxin [Gammaproteobacteria bacterium]|jgi:PIN domain nuclease of toxin-antitoxin system|nr:type II toxin-antitoxin system VapC family toxin [Gammaproteobacteria bacterium]